MAHQTGNRGVALVTALAILVVVALLVLGVSFSTRIELFVTRNDTTSTQANYVAQAGLQAYKVQLFQYYRWLESTGVTQVNPARTACFNRLSYGLELDRNVSNIQNGTFQYTWSSSNSIGPFTGTVLDASGTSTVGTYSVTLYRDPNNNNRYSITSVGTSNGAKSTARATFTIQNSGVLEQAIFAGTGQANKSLNGGATIRGGIYVVGAPSTTAIDANGNFSLLNSYDLVTDYGSANGTQIAQYVTSQNQVANNLCATLRVEQGNIALGGSTVLGQPTNKLLGVYVGSGTADISYQGNFLNTCTQTKGVCTDDLGKFNLSNPPTFPTFDGPPNSQECTQSTWRACIHADAVSHGFQAINGAVTTPPGGAPNNGDWINNCVTPMATRDLVLGAGTFINCTYNYNGRTYGFKFDGTVTPAQFEVYGSVDLSGYNVSIETSTEYTAASYGGTNATNNASFVVEDPSCGQGPVACTYGNVNLDADLVPNASGGSADQFPNNVLGIIAEHDMYQRGQYVMAPVYAGNTFRIIKDNVLFGSVISNMFCTTSAGSKTDCTAGQKSEVVYINTANNKPALLKQISPKAGIPTFAVDSYELK